MPLVVIAILLSEYELGNVNLCTIPVPVIVLYLCHTLVSSHANLNSTELHLQSVAPRSQYSDPAPEVVTLQ